MNTQDSSDKEFSIDSAETERLAQDARREKNWKRWGPYLSERQWGTVREDYSAAWRSPLSGRFSSSTNIIFGCQESASFRGMWMYAAIIIRSPVPAK